MGAHLSPLRAASKQPFVWHCAFIGCQHYCINVSRNHQSSRIESGERGGRSFVTVIGLFLPMPLCSPPAGMRSVFTTRSRNGAAPKVQNAGWELQRTVRATVRETTSGNVLPCVGHARTCRAAYGTDQHMQHSRSWEKKYKFFSEAKMKACSQTHRIVSGTSRVTTKGSQLL